MTKKTSAASMSSLVKRAALPVYRFPGRHTSIRVLWFSLTLVIIVGLVVSGVIALVINYWLNNVHFSPTLTNVTVPTITTLDVQRTSLYSGLEFTVSNAQYAQSFEDDTIPSSIGGVRLNVQV